MNWFAFKKPAAPKIWGYREDGSKYRTGITVAALREALLAYRDDDEICMAIECGKDKHYTGVLEKTNIGCTGQMWLEGHVLDQSQER